MASVISAIRNIASDVWWFPKLAVVTVMYFILYSHKNVLFDFNSNYWMFGLVLFVVLLGSALILIHRNINNIAPILPGLFDIPELLIKAISGFITIVPATILISICYYFVNKNLSFEPIVMYIIYGGIAIFFMPFFFIPLVLYSVKGRLSDGFKYSILFRGAGNFIVQIIAFILQYLLVIGLLSYLIYNILYNILGTNTNTNIIVQAFLSFIEVLTFYLIFSFSSDLYGEAIPELSKGTAKNKTKK